MKIIISPAQAVLMLIDRNQNDPDLVRKLSEILLSGISTDEDREFLNQQLNNPLFHDYKVRFDYRTINEDPVKRYFETHLAYHTLRNKLGNLDVDLLRKQFEAVKNITFKKIVERLLPHAIPLIYKEINAALHGRSKNNNEYSAAFNAIQQGSMYADFSEEEKEKILMLIQSALLSTFSGKLNFLPVDIYGTGLFTEEIRGRRKHDDTQKEVGSRNIGLLKSYMPLPASDLAYVEDPSAYLRPADQFQLENPNTEWTSESFARLMHPFSSGISGTTLSNLRMLLYLKSKDQLEFEDLQSFSEYFKLFASAMLYNAGGHSYYEFISTLTQVPELLDEYENFMPGVEQISMNSLLLDDNANAFNLALQEAIDYNKQIIRLRSVNAIIHLKNDIAELTHECSVYRDYLHPIVDQELNKLNLVDNNGNRLRASDLTPSRIDEILGNQSVSASARLLFEKLKAVLELIDIVTGRADFEASIQNFKNKFTAVKDTLESNRDIAAISILKILDKNLQRLNVRQSTGGLFVKNIQKRLTELDENAVQKDIHKSVKK